MRKEVFDSDFSSRLCFSVSREMVDRFAKLTGDASSLHMDADFARQSVYRKRIVHGMLPVAYIAMVPDLRVNGVRPRLESIRAHFAAPVFCDDRLEMLVELADAAQSDETVRLAFRIEKAVTGAVVTTGEFALSYRQRDSGDARHSAEGHTPGRPLPDGEIEMRSLQAADLAKGMQDDFDFTVSEDAAARLLSILQRGLEGPGSSGAMGPEACPELSAISMFSTLVGMRIPGESATFLEFEAEIRDAIPIGVGLNLCGTVSHVSMATKIIKTKIDLTRADRPDDRLVVGRVVTIANPPRDRRRTIKELKASCLDLGLKGKVVLITGATGGIGETTAKLFSLHGSRVVVNYRQSREDAERIVDEIVGEGGEAIAVGADVSDATQVDRMIEAAIDTYGTVDVLVNNAVRDFRSIAFDDLAWDEVQRDIDINVKGAFLCSKAVASVMLERGGGKIVNISSIYAEAPPRDQLKYVVSKAALVGLTRALAVEFASRHIQVNTVVPSFVDTDIASHIYDGLRKEMARRSPMNRNATPEDVACSIVFLASRYSTHTTGQKIMVTGGEAPYL